MASELMKDAITHTRTQPRTHEHATRAQAIMQQAERESWDALHNRTVADTPESLAAAGTLAVNSGITDGLGRAGVTIPEEFLDELTWHIMSGACIVFVRIFSFLGVLCSPRAHTVKTCNRDYFGCNSHDEIFVPLVL